MDNDVKALWLFAACVQHPVDKHRTIGIANARARACAREPASARGSKGTAKGVKGDQKPQGTKKTKRTSDKDVRSGDTMGRE